MDEKNTLKMTLLRDSEWSAIDGEVCRVINFNPFASVKDGKISALDASMPYASLTIQCKRISEQINGFITNKTDFQNLWHAFMERTVTEDEEVLIVWNKSHHKILARFLSAALPGLVIWICKKGAWELMHNPDHRPELKGTERFMAERPIVEIKPDMME